MFCRQSSPPSLDPGRTTKNHSPGGPPSIPGRGRPLPPLRRFVFELTPPSYPGQLRGVGGAGGERGGEGVGGGRRGWRGCWCEPFLLSFFTPTPGPGCGGSAGAFGWAVGQRGGGGGRAVGRDPAGTGMPGAGGASGGCGLFEGWGLPGAGALCSMTSVFESTTAWCTMKPLSLRLLAIMLVAGSLAWEAAAQGAPDSLRRPFDVTHYDARVEPNISDKTIKGIVVLDLVVTAENQSTVELDSGDLTIDAVKEGGTLVDFDARDHRLTIRWPRPARVKEARQLEVQYHGAPRSGMQFFSERPQVYTVFSTSQWLVCVDAPDDRATLNLSVVLPAGLTMVASGKPVAQHALSNGTVAHEWRQDWPMPSHTFGFAAGRFTDVTENRKGHRLRYLGSDFSTAELRRIFADSADMMRFFEDRAGVPYRELTYTQALVANTVGQEMSGFSVMSEDYGRAVLGDSHAESLIAHELAHQWWGNSVTCGAWTHMWLNEGFATFMAAAFMEQRFGRDEYLRTVEAWRSRYSKGPRRRARSLARVPGLESPDARRPHTGVPKGGLRAAPPARDTGRGYVLGRLSVITRAGTPARRLRLSNFSTRWSDRPVRIFQSSSRPGCISTEAQDPVLRSVSDRNSTRPVARFRPQFKIQSAEA